MQSMRLICEIKDKKKNEFQLEKLPRKILIVREASCRSEATCRCGNIKILIKYYLNLKLEKRYILGLRLICSTLGKFSMRATCQEM